MALIYIFPAVFLWKYADRIAVFMRERSTGALASALEAQKSFWKFVGILTAVVLAIYAAIFVVAIWGVVAVDLGRGVLDRQGGVYLAKVSANGLGLVAILWTCTQRLSAGLQ